MVSFRILILCICVAPFAAGKAFPGNIPESLLKSDQFTSDLEQWLPHILEFMELIDIEQLIMITMKYISDPEVADFAVFVTSSQFSQLVYEFESMDEFKEAIEFLTSKGYDVKSMVEYINAALDLPPFEKPYLMRANNKGISGLLQDTVAALPIEDMKKLFQNKLETNPEMAELFETISSEEFVHILKKMSHNPKFKEFKKTFESYGFDFEIICAAAKDILGEHYQGIFCE